MAKDNTALKFAVMSRRFFITMNFYYNTIIDNVVFDKGN